jgi:hypothetical protein
VLHEPVGSDDRDLPGLHVVRADDALDPAEVVDVRVRVDDRPDRPVAPLPAVQREGRGRGLLRDQRVDHDDALDHAHDRQVEAPQLVDARHHLEQAVAGQQLALAPQAGVHGVGRGAGEEGVGVEVPHEPPVGGGDLPLVAAGDEPALHVLEVLGVVPRQRAHGVSVVRFARQRFTPMG